jgi:hypothetical protein
MLKCKFCGRHFPSDQSLYAHFKHCEAYRKHKMKKQFASLGQALPKEGSRKATSSLVPSLPNPPDPFAPIRQLLEQMGVPTSPRPDETPQECRRRLLQAAKSQVIDRHWSFNGMRVTAQMRAEARLAIERKLRDEPLEEFAVQEIMELAEGIRDGIYTSFLQQQEQDAQRARQLEEQKRRDENHEVRQERDRSKKKAAFMEEAARRLRAWFKTRSLSPLERLGVWEDLQIQLEEVLTGAESPPDAYATIEVLLQARVAEWNAQEEAMEAKRHEEWLDIAIVILGLVTFGFLYYKAPAVLLWILQVLSPGPTDNSRDATQPPGDTEPSPPHEPRARRRVKRPGHPIAHPPLEPPIPP